MVFEEKEDGGCLLRMLRERKNLTQEDISQGLRVSQTTVVNWETGITKPKPANLKNLIELFLVNNIFTPGKELSEAHHVWVVFDLNAQFDLEWFNSLLQGLNNTQCFSEQYCVDSEVKSDDATGKINLVINHNRANRGGIAANNINNVTQYKYKSYSQTKNIQRSE